MTTKEKILTGLFVLLLLWAGYGAYKEALLKQTLAATDHQAKDNIKLIQQDQATKDAAYEKRLADLTALKQRVVTVRQVVHDLPAVLPLPEAVHAVTDKQAAGANAADPTAPAIEADDIVIPKADAKPLFDAQVEAQKCQVSLADSLSKYASLQKIDTIKDDQIKQRDTVIKGGTKWARAKTAGKWTLVGAAIGGLVVEYLSHK